MKNILITGAGGFVGRSLTEHLSGKYNIFALKRADLNLLSQQAVADFLTDKNIDVTFHCANQGGSRISGYDSGASDVVATNLQMFMNLKSGMTENMKMVAFGSGAQYNKQRNLVKIREDEIGQIIPDDVYGFSKLLQYNLVQNSDNIISPIIFGLYGKHEDYRFKFISNAIIKNLLKQPIVINQNVVFDYLFIDDFLNIMELVIENDCNLKSFNITPSESIDLVSVCNIINEISDYQSDIIVRNEGLNFQYTGINSLMLGTFDGYAFMTYKEGIKRLYGYFTSVMDSVDSNEIINDEYIKYCKVNK